MNPRDLELVFVSGLTGVGKSSTLATLKDTNLTLLPNRRTLTDEIIIPQVQLDLGNRIELVADRLERFDLTKYYRDNYGGIVTALRKYLNSADVKTKAQRFVFDNVRGLPSVGQPLRP